MFHVERIYLSTKLLTVLRLFGVDSKLDFESLNSYFLQPPCHFLGLNISPAVSPHRFFINRQ